MRQPPPKPSEELPMTPVTPARDDARIDRFFALPEDRTDSWLDLERAARAWEIEPASKDLASACAEKLAALLALEGYFAYPGPALVALVRQRVASGDARGVARLVGRIAMAMMNHRYRRDPSTWE